MDRLLNVTTAVSVVLLLMVLFSIRRAHIRVEYSMSWLFAACGLLALSRSRPALNFVASRIGLGSDFALVLFFIVRSLCCVVFSSLSSPLPPRHTRQPPPPPARCFFFFFFIFKIWGRQ